MMSEISNGESHRAVREARDAIASHPRRYLSAETYHQLRRRRVKRDEERTDSRDERRDVSDLPLASAQREEGLTARGPTAHPARCGSARAPANAERRRPDRRRP